MDWQWIGIRLVWLDGYCTALGLVQDFHWIDEFARQQTSLSSEVLGWSSAISRLYGIMEFGITELKNYWIMELWNAASTGKGCSTPPHPPGRRCSTPWHLLWHPQKGWTSQNYWCTWGLKYTLWSSVLWMLEEYYPGNQIDRYWRKPNLH